MEAGINKIVHILLLLCFFYSQSIAQNKASTVIKGVITDAETGEAISFVNISSLEKKIGTLTDFEGKYVLVLKEPLKQLRISCVGYKAQIIKLSNEQNQVINIKLKKEINVLKEVDVKPEKKRYKNKDNPAVNLIDKVIENKTKNHLDGVDSYHYEKYEKTQFALINISEKFKNRKALKKFQFIFDNVDTTKLKNKEVLPIFLKETVSDFYYRKTPPGSKEIVSGNKMVSFDGYIDNQGLTEYLKYFYQDIDIYNNNVFLLTNTFVSPIAGIAPTLYKYFIIDTTSVDSDKCIRVFFSPRNKTDLLLQGYIYVMMDSSYAIRKVDMTVNKEINLNWAREIKIVQQFDKKNTSSKWVKNYDELSIDFGVTKSNMGLYGQRAVSIKNLKINDSLDNQIFAGPKLIEDANVNNKDTAYWKLHRQQQLTKSEEGTYKMMDSIQKIPAFKRTMDLVFFLLFGYKDIGYFEIGPVSTFYSYNPIEGIRLRFGGRTTAKFSKKINFETYLAYGFKDEKYKYYFGGIYSLTDKTIYQFPVKSIKVSVQDETKIPGQELQFIQEDNVFLSIKRGVNDKLLYNKAFRIEHLNEFDNHFSYFIGYELINQSPAGSLYFNQNDYLLHTNSPDHINISRINLTLRYAPNEQFYQGKTYRIPLIGKSPVFKLDVSTGMKSVLADDYDYTSLKLSINKRFYLSVLGYTDVAFEAGKVLGKVPYPYLFIHRANQTYSYQLQSYNLMNFLEFVSDQYSSLNIDHYFNGFIFNKIPLLKKLKFREVVTAKFLYGGITDKNNPDYHSDLFRLPVENDGTPLTYSLESKPYIEVSAGVANILKFFRIDYVRRLTYINHPNVATSGIRIRFKLDF